MCAKQLDIVLQRSHRCQQPLALRQEVQPLNLSPHGACGSSFEPAVEKGEGQAAALILLLTYEMRRDLVASCGNGSLCRTWDRFLDGPTKGQDE